MTSFVESEFEMLGQSMRIWQMSVGNPLRVGGGGEGHVCVASLSLSRLVDVARMYLVTDLLVLFPSFCCACYPGSVAMYVSGFMHLS
jgi:hypothetical protein